MGDPQKLTDAWIRDQPRNGQDAWDALVGGLVLRMWEVPSWCYVYRVGGARRRYGMGPYRTPDARDGLTIAGARDAAERLAARVHLGADPVQERRAERAAASVSRGITVAELVGQYLATVALRDSTRREWSRVLRAELGGALGRRPAAALSRRDVRAWTDAIVARPAPAVANQAWGLLRAVYGWAVERDILEASPLVGMTRPAPAGKSERVLTEAELGALLRALELLQVDRRSGKDTPRDRAYADAIRLLLLTGVRESAVVRARSVDFNLAEAVWTVPPEDSKRRAGDKRAHLVPLSPAALDVVRRRGDGWLFPARRRGLRGLKAGEGPMTWSSRFVTDLRAKMAELLRAEVPRWTVHNLRHTLATTLRERLGVQRNVIALLLGHTQSGGGGSTHVYDRAELLAERRDALTRWADWLEARQVHPPGQ